MIYIFRQWRFLRYLNKRSRKERPSEAPEYHFGFRSQAPDVIAGYAAKTGKSEVDVQRLLKACVKSHYIDEDVQLQNNGMDIKTLHAFFIFVLNPIVIKQFSHKSHRPHFTHQR